MITSLFSFIQSSTSKETNQTLIQPEQIPKELQKIARGIGIFFDQSGCDYIQSVCLHLKEKDREPFINQFKALSEDECKKMIQKLLTIGKHIFLQEKADQNNPATQGKKKKKKVKLTPDLTLEYESSQPIIPSTKELLSLKLKLDNLVRQAGITSTDWLPHLIKKIPLEKLVTYLDKLEPHQQKMMCHTLHKIIQVLPKFQFLRSSRSRVQYQQAEPKKTYAFAINQNNIFTCFEQISEGTEKKIYDAYCLNLSKPFVALEIKHKDPILIEHINTEITYLQKLHEIKNVYLAKPYISQPFKPTKSDSDPCYVLFQKKYNGDGSKLNCSFPALLNYFKGAALGLASLHKTHLIHGDVKPENIFFKHKDASYLAKIGDFGLLVNQGHQIYGGTLGYLPPEALVDGENIKPISASPAIDSFALGMTMLEMLIKPWFRANQFYSYFTSPSSIQLLFNTLRVYFYSSHFFGLRAHLNSKLTVLNICQQLTQFDPEKRLSCLQAAEKLELLQEELKDINDL